MLTTRHDLAINGMCLLFGVGALGVAGWVVLSGQVGKLGVDGLFLLLVCLLIALAFLASPLGAIRMVLRQRATGRVESQAKPQGEN